MTAPAPPPAAITLLLPDGQELRVRLYERLQMDTGLWVFRIGVPLWQTTEGGGVEPAEYGTWVTSAQLRPIPGVALDQVPTHRNPAGRAAATATPWVWVLDGRARPTTVHAEGCPLATDRAVPVKTMDALDALGQPGTVACTGCDAAETLLPILAHGQEDAHAPGD
ncbi:DUF6233 domain-containing protein [Streptomyces katrae]|uniref:DUF6233 domain-containing protein n=1 Tax=Streptomyces katrae TaxID=68223 RepID=UPI0006991567|nr:DUF6233 domain-containing protein [Streptomyces katrae]